MQIYISEDPGPPPPHCYGRTRGGGTGLGRRDATSHEIPRSNLRFYALIWCELPKQREHQDLDYSAIHGLNPPAMMDLCRNVRIGLR